MLSAMPDLVFDNGDISMKISSSWQKSIFCNRNNHYSILVVLEFLQTCTYLGT